MRILHIISSLNDGGAEAVLFRLCAFHSEHEHIVVSMQGSGKYGEPLLRAGVELLTLNMSPGKFSFFGLIQLFRYLKYKQPDVVQTWMYHSDLIGGVIARLAGFSKVVWGIHNTDLDSRRTKFKTRAVAKVCAWLSDCVPAKVVSCSHRGVLEHIKLGYSAEKFAVVPNGYDVSHFSFDPIAREEIRKFLNIEKDTFLIGMVARFDPQKDHANLIHALEIASKFIDGFHCLLVGRGMDTDNKELMDLISRHSVGNKISLLGGRPDIPAIMSSIDLHVLSSASEAFPNVICEAMSCSTPCLTTNVGDAAFIVGDTGWVVAPQNSRELADSLLKVFEVKTSFPLEWSKVRLAARSRISEQFSLEAMVSSYSKIWKS
jgi:glycosyltransferase involved in cell wall biosynthesis